MSEQYCQSVLRIALAQICQSVGWNSAQSTPLELLTDVMGRYMLQLAKVTHRYGEQFGRTNPNLDDVGLAFRHMGVSISELEEYVRHVEPLPFAHEIVQFPAPRSSNLQIPKPGHKELLTREEHIEEYMPLMFPTPEDEMDTEAEKTQDQNEGTAVLQSNQGQTGVTGQTEVTDINSLTIPGDKRTLTSPLEGSLPKKRPRLTNAALPEEAMHSQYEIKSIAITHTGDLTPTKGGKLPDARTPPQGFKKASHDKPSVAKNSRKDKADTRPSTPVNRTEKATENEELLKAETAGKEKVQTVEEIMIYPDGRSEKVPRQKEIDEVSDSEPLPKSAPASAQDKISAPSPSTQVPPKRKKVGRPRSRSKSPRTSKSPAQGKSPARSPGSSRGRGRPPKDKSLLKNPDKKKDHIKNKPVLSTMEEMFASDVLDLSRKPPPVSAPKENVEKKETMDVDVPLDLSKSKEPTQAHKSARGRGRPPLSPEKKRVRERNIDLCIEAVLQRSREGNTEGDALKEKEIKAEKVTELAESNQEDTNPAIEDSSDAPSSVTVKKEMIEESGPLFDISDQKKKKKKERALKQKEEQSGEEVKDKLKDKLKGKDSVGEGIKTEPQEEVAGPPNVYDFPESPPKPAEQIKNEAVQSPQKMFSVEFVDKEMENKEGEKAKEKSKDKERSKEHKEKRKEKKRDKEKKKKNKDKDREREKKKEKSKEPDYIPTVSKLKIRIGSSPSSTTVNYMSPTNDSAQNSPRPELKLVIKALPPKSDRDSISPQSFGGSTPRNGEKERKKEKKKDREKKKETPAPAPSPHLPIKQESIDQPLLPISRQHTPFSSSPSKSPTPPPPRKPSPPGLFTPFIKTPTPPPRKTPTPPPRKIPTPPPPRKSPTPPPPKVPTPTPKPPTPETDFEPDSDHETEVMKDEEELQRFTPSPASTRKTFTPSPSNSPLRSPSPAAESVTSYMRSKSNSQSPVRSPSPGQSTSPHPSAPPSPSPSPFRASVSPSNTKPSTPSHIASRSPSPSPSPSSTPRTIKSEIIPPMPPPSMPGISSVKAGVQRTVIAETVTTFIDESGQKVWICPACKMPDDGSPMIGCDICDDWYHWPCVGVKEEPAEDENWYCSKCMGRNKKPAKRGRGRGRGRGPGRGKKKIL